ncbi:unnamed protein product [Durusdinium trenchii]|uniref:UVR domain-containing protein n=2 Tax=Durusdinium trenchii TaxID=1381693 RepID=A0ABP0L8Y8_9DINO
MAQEELQVAIDKAHWPKNVLRVLMPALRKLGDSHGHIIVAPQPARGIIHLQGAAKHIEAAKPGLRALIEEHFPEADIPKELLKPSELPEAPEAPEMGSEPEKSAEQMEKEAPKEVDSPQVLATKALKRAYATHSASAMRIALGAAYSAGVGQAALEEGERWLKELTAAAALGVVLQKDASIQELQAALMAAREACVDEARLEEAELQLGRLETQEALVKAMGGSEAELREALAAARACGSDVDILAEAEARLCTLAAETELLSAMELVQSLEMSGAVDEETEVVFAAAVREAETAAVSGPLLADANVRLARLAAQREAQLSQKRAATAEVDSNSKRQKTQETEENGEGDTGVTDGNALQEWARSLLESALLICCKRNAVEAEDFDLALALKQQEAAVGDRVQKVKEKCQATPDDFAQLEEVRRQKLEAVEKEDYDRAMELKELEKQLQNRRQLEEVHAIAAAARLLSDSRPEDLLPGLLPTLADQAKAAPELWHQVAEELRRT